MGWMKLNAKFSQQVSQGLGFKLEIPWRKTCVFNIPCTSIHNYPHAIEKLETWKCGWYISRNHPGNTYKIIKYSVWYILHIFCIYSAYILHTWNVDPVDPQLSSAIPPTPRLYAGKERRDARRPCMLPGEIWGFHHYQWDVNKKGMSTRRNTLRRH